LVDPGSPESFATAAAKILSDPELARSMRAEAVAWGNRFSWERSVDCLRGLYATAN
jgi:glycosyltransferase involved in cell wall biosynthesis